MADRTIQGPSKSLLGSRPIAIGPILKYRTSGNWTSRKFFRATASRQLHTDTPRGKSITDYLRKLITITCGHFVRVGNKITIFLRSSLNMVRPTARAEKQTQKIQANVVGDFQLSALHSPCLKVGTLLGWALGRVLAIQNAQRRTPAPLLMGKSWAL